MKDLFPRPVSKTFLSAVLAGLFLLSMAADRAGAVTNDVWNGGAAPNGNWQNANNWGGTAPVALDALYFDGATQTSATNDFPAGTMFGNLAFNGTADAFSLYGNSLVLVAFTNGIDSSTVNPIGGNITNASGNAQTIKLPLTLSAGRHAFATIGGGQLNLNGAVTRNPGATVMFSPGAGPINVTGAFTTNGFNNILGGWATIGVDWATLDADSNVVAFTGYTDIGAGTIVSDPTSNVRYIGDTTNITAASGTRINSLLTQQGAARSLIITNTMKLGAKGGIYRLGTGVMTITGGTIVADGGGELTFYDNPFNAAGGNNINIVSAISNDGPNVVSVNIMGYVQYGQVVGAVNTYSGGTYINQGRVQITPLLGFGTGPVYVFPGGQILFNSNGTYTNSFFIGGVGTPENNGLGALRMGGAARILSGRVTLMGDATIGNNGRISGPISGVGVLSIGHGNSANGHGVIQVGGAIANDYSGDTVINGTASQAADTLQINTGFNNIMPHGAGKGNVILNAGSATATATFDLAGTTQTINALLNSANSPANDFVTSSAAGGVLIAGDNDATAIFGGRIQSAVALTKIGTGSLTLTGANTYTNATTVNGGLLVFGGGSFSAATPLVSVNSNATLDVAAVCPLTLGAGQALAMSNGTVIVLPQASGSAITTPALTANGTTNRVTVTAVPAIASYPAQFTLIKYTALTGTLNFGLGGPLPPSPGLPYAGFISNNVANGSVDLVITAGPASLRWTGYSGGAPNSAWDIAATPNWRTLGGTPTTYPDGSFTLFDDSASNGVVTLSQSVSPAGITVTNSSLAYTINDGFAGFSINGVGSLNKQGNGTLILDNFGLNNFSGGVTIAGGTLQVGNNDTAGNLPASGTIGNNGTLTFAHVDDVTLANSISGTGALTQNGTGALLLNGVNTFTGAVNVVQGTLKLGNNAALGTTNGGTTVASGATLDITANSINLGQERVTASGSGVGGQGAVINSSGVAAFSTPNIARLIFAGDTTLGGSGRWDLRAATNTDPALASLSTGGAARKLTKVGGNQVSIVGVTVDPALGDIEVQGGILSIETATTGIGNIASNLTVLSGASLQFFAATNRLNKNFIIHDGGSVINNSGANTVIGPMFLTNSSLSLAPYITFNVAGTSLLLSNTLTGDGIIYKATGTAPLTLNGNSPSFVGGVYLNTGTLTLNGTLNNALGVTMVSGTRFNLNGTLSGAGLTNNFNSTLSAFGTSLGPVDVSGNLLPGDAGVAGTFNAGGLTLQATVNWTNDLNSTTAIGGGTNDLIVVNGDLIINGGLLNINPLGLLLTGVPYRLINYSGSLIKTADLTVLSQGAYTFTLDYSTTNQVNLVVAGGPPVWNGGSATVNNWSDPANWNGTTIQPGDSLYFGGLNRVNNFNDAPPGTSYTDLAFIPGAGSFILNGNPIALGGSVVNNAPIPETVNLGLEFSVNRTLNGAVGTLIIGGGVTNTAGPGVNTLTLTGAGILTNLLGSVDPSGTNTILLNSTNANWTLADNSASSTITVPWVLNVNNGTFNFGSATTAPKLTSTTVNGAPQDHIVGAVGNTVSTFTMSNGIFTTSARLNTGTAANATGIVNQVGGTMNIGSQIQGANGAATAVSFLNFSGGTLNVIDTQLRPLYVASRGPGTLTVSGSATINCGVLDVSRSINSSIPGIVNLNGGTLSVSRVGTATANSVATTTGSTATFNFNGGTLRANASSTTFIQGNTSGPAVPIVAVVKSGGAIIDSTNFNISIVEPLIHDASLGATPDGGLIKKGPGQLTLTAANTYTGATVVTNGTLLINGTLALTPVIVATNGTLGGSGVCASNVTVQLGGTISPGNSAGTLTVSNGVSLQGRALMEIQKSANTNDRLRNIVGTITYGGALVVTNLGGTLVGGESYKLFESPTYGGAFTSMQLPPLGAGLSWNTTQLLVSGTISVSGTIIPPGIGSVVQVGSTIVTSGTNGAPFGPYVVLSSTNLTLPIANWTRVQTNAFDAFGGFSFTNAIDPSRGNEFFRLLMQ